MMNTRKKIISLILGIILIISVFDSYACIPEQYRHHCNNSCCDICMKIQAARNMIDNLADTLTYIIIAVTPFILAEMCNKYREIRLKSKTLISLKVELLN